jgi:hypothetical protein
MSELLIMIEGNLIGRVGADKAGRLSLDYEAGWRESPQGHSLSRSVDVRRPSRDELEQQLTLSQYDISLTGSDPVICRIYKPRIPFRRVIERIRQQ